MILSFNSVLLILILLAALISLLIVERSVMRVSTTISTYGKLDTGKRNQVL